MFATRNHDENAIHQHQQAAAAKPLNQGVKGLAPKTPANKKVPLNDENAAFGKTGGKGKGGGLFGDPKGGKVEKSAFVTPAGPRTRAPLGNKTTNAKATAFLTPAGAEKDKSASASLKPTSPRLRRAKVKIHTADADPLNRDGEGEEREIEYMPPREVPLPDHPDDCWPCDRAYPQFEGGKLTRGWWGEFGGSKGDGGGGSEGELSDYEEKVRMAEEGRRKREAGKAAAAAEVKGPATVKARGAVSALSSSSAAVSKQRSMPGFAAPTAAAKARLPSVPVGRKPGSGSTAQGNTRHTAARVASNTTLGYSKGRAVSATARKPLSGIHEGPAGKEAAKKKVFSSGSTLDELLGLHDVGIGEDQEDGDLGDIDGGVAVPVDEELDGFQLEAVEV